MYEPRPPQQTPPAAGRSVLETVIVAVGTTGLLFGAAMVAFTAAAIADDPVLAAAIAAFVWFGTIVVGILGVRRLVRTLGRRTDRWRLEAERVATPFDGACARAR